MSLLLKDFENYVLKPQREGGGNKFFGPEIKYFLCFYLIISIKSFKLLFFLISKQRFSRPTKQKRTNGIRVDETSQGSRTRELHFKARP